MTLQATNIVLSSGISSTKTSMGVKLPSITVHDLPKANNPAVDSFDAFNRDQKKEADSIKYKAKFVVAISTLLTAACVTPEIIQHTREISNVLIKQIARIALPIAAGVAVGGIASAICQKALSGEVKKEYLYSDLKDALVTSSVVRGYTGLISNSGKLFNSLIMMEYSKWVKRFSINGLIGGSYALLRGIVKPDEEDKLTLKSVLEGIVEGIFLGEGARFISKRDFGLQKLPMPANIRKLLSFTKVIIGATIGSIAFRTTTFLSNKLKNDVMNTTPNPLKEETLIEHVFKGNSYPTIIKF